MGEWTTATTPASHGWILSAPSRARGVPRTNWLKVATSSRSGYFGMPCGAKKNLGWVEKFEKTRFFQYFYWRILEIYWNLKFWKKLSHKNAIKMIWGGPFFYCQAEKYLKLWLLWSKLWLFFDKILGLLFGAFWLRKWRLLIQNI